VHRSNRDDFFNSGWFSDAVATSRAATACQNILASQHQRLGLEHWTRRLVSGHSAQCLSETTPMAMTRNNKKNAGIQFGSNGTTYLHPVPFPAQKWHKIQTEARTNFWTICRSATNRALI